MSKLISSILILVFCGFFASAFSQPTVEQILQGLEKREKAIHDLKVMYQVVRARPLPDVEEMKKNPDLAGKGYYYFQKRLELFAMSSEGYVWETLQSINSTKYNAGVQHWHMIRTMDNMNSTGDIWDDYANHLTVNGPKIPIEQKLNFITTSAYANNQLFMAYWPVSRFLRNYKDIHIKKSEKANGYECAVLSFSDNTNKNMRFGLDISLRYWIDWQHGYAPVRFQHIYNGFITEHDYLDLRDFGNGIWLPMKIELKPALNPDERGKPRTSILQVLKIGVNENLPLGSLKFNVPRGCLVKEINEWPIKQNDNPTEEEKKEMAKRGEKLTLEEEATYFKSLFGISYPEVIAMFDKIEY
jgi:hypothetical protein